jgi:imidazolonepropionase
MSGSVVVTGIGELTTQDPDLGTVRDAAVVAEGDAITWVGPPRAPAADRRIDVGGRAVVPGFVDSHTTSCSPATGRASSPPDAR